MCLQIMCIYIYIYSIYMYKEDLALNNLQCLICLKTKPNQTIYLARAQVFSSEQILVTLFSNFLINMLIESLSLC